MMLILLFYLWCRTYLQIAALTHSLYQKVLSEVT